MNVFSTPKVSPPVTCGIKEVPSVTNKNIRILEALEPLITSGMLWAHISALDGDLWDLAKAYSVFFENCPVLKAPTPELKDSRLVLVDLVGRVIKQALELLGIKTVERM